MKKIIYNFIFVILLIGIPGCNDDDFIKEKPYTFYTPENAFNTSAQVQASVTNMYVHIRYWFQLSPFFKAAGTDVLDRPMWRSGGNGYSNFSSWSTQHGDVNSVYESLYMLGAYANFSMEGAQLKKITWNNEAERNAVISQGKFFRGFAYLNLGELFGGVPLVDRYIPTPKYDFVRSSREETYEFAIRDFKDAIAGLPDYPSEAGHVAKGAAYHYLAETYLALATIKNNDAATLQLSIDAATKAIDLHPLMSQRFGTRSKAIGGIAMNGVDAYVPNGNVYFDLFQRGNMDYVEGNTEAMWTLQNDYQVYKQYGGNNYLNYPRTYGPVLRDVKWKVQFIEADKKSSPWSDNTMAYVGGRGVSDMAPTKYVINGIWAGNLVNDMRNDPINIRRDLVCTNVNHSMYGQVVPISMLEENTLDRYYPIWTKGMPLDDWGYEDLEDGGNRSNYYRDDYACRSAETYLIRAEAYLRKGDKLNAAADINTIRNRSHCTYLVSSGDVTIQFILDERARELFMEERRWATLLRMGADGIKSIADHAYYIADYPRGTAPKWQLFPIPQKVIDSNTGAVLDQNEGWK